MKRFVWEEAGRADLRRIDRETAVRILVALTRYGDTGQGDVKRLTDREGLFRLRVGKWRIFSTWTRRYDPHPRCRQPGRGLLTCPLSGAARRTATRPQLERL